MLKFDIGDLVTRKSYNHDLVFIVTDIIDGTYYLKGSNVRLCADSPEEDLDEYLQEYKTLYLDLETNSNVNHNSFGLSLKQEIIEKGLNNDIKDIYNDVVKLRMAKQPCEIACIRKAIKTTKTGIESLMKNVRSGMYEYQLEAYYDFEIKKDGNKPVSFKTIAASGVNATSLFIK